MDFTYGSVNSEITFENNTFSNLIHTNNGHAYFMGMKSAASDSNIKVTFKNNSYIEN